MAVEGIYTFARQQATPRSGYVAALERHEMAGEFCDLRQSRTLAVKVATH